MILFDPNMPRPVPAGQKGVDIINERKQVNDLARQHNSGTGKQERKTLPFWKGGLSK
jgi:hypothetical protein